MNKSKILLCLLLSGLVTACSTTQNPSTSSEADYAPVPAPEPPSATKMASPQATSAQNRVRSEERLGTKWG
ncbi:MAG: hypothetical protein RR575_16440, partial [Acinetobacter sp.]